LPCFGLTQAFALTQTDNPRRRVLLAAAVNLRGDLGCFPMHLCSVLLPLRRLLFQFGKVSREAAPSLGGFKQALLYNRINRLLSLLQTFDSALSALLGIKHLKPLTQYPSR
jgi:hypothetical protein